MLPILLRLGRPGPHFSGLKSVYQNRGLTASAHIVIEAVEGASRKSRKFDDREGPYTNFATYKAEIKTQYL